MKVVTKAIGILGGTFDPIHKGHLQLAQELLQLLPLKELRLIPCAQNALKQQAPQANAEHRLAMIKLAIQGYKKITVDERELQRSQPSYMIDTVISLQQQHPNTLLYLIMSSDAFSEFDHWHRYNEILHYCNIIVTPRPNFQFQPNAKMVELIKQRRAGSTKDLLTSTTGKLLFLPIPHPSPISATEIRNRIKTGKEVTTMLPETIQEYITKHQLYQ